MITQVVVKRLQHMICIIDFQSAYCQRYKNELNFIAAKKEMHLQWEAKEKGKIQEIIAFLNTPEGRQYVVEFAKTAGR